MLARFLMKKLPIILSLMVFLSVFATGQFGFDPNGPNQGPQDPFFGGDPFGGPQGGPQGPDPFAPRQGGPDPFAGPSGDPFGDSDPFVGSGPQGQQNYNQPQRNNQGPQGGFGFEGDRLGFDFGGADITQADVGGGVYLVTLKMSNALLRAMNASKSDFKNACLDGKQEELISQISAAFEENKGSVRQICDRYNQRAQNFSTDICDPAIGMNLPLPRDMQEAASEAGVELGFDSDASSF